MHRRDLELLAARPADHLIIDTDQMVAELGKLGAVAFVRPGRKPVFLGPANPPHRVFVGPAAAGTCQPLGPIVVLVEEESAFV
jgi:hypothetical protein